MSETLRLCVQLTKLREEQTSNQILRELQKLLAQELGLTLKILKCLIERSQHIHLFERQAAHFILGHDSGEAAD